MYIYIYVYIGEVFLVDDTRCSAMAWPTNIACPEVLPQSLVGDGLALGCPSIWECLPIYWATPLYGNAVPYTGAPQCMGMHSHILGFPSTWECSPIY